MKRPQWSGRLAFILAASGSAVGLGNIWKFPYITGENGGGAFVLVYLLCVAFIGFPILVAEILIGRRGRANPVAAYRELEEEADVLGPWHIFGGIGIAAAIIMLSFYSVIAGWSVAYAVKFVTGSMSQISAANVEASFKAFISSPQELVIWHTLFMCLTVGVVARGVRQGLEKTVGLLMPLLVGFLLLLLVYSWSTGKLGHAFTYMFAADFSRLTPSAVLTALGHAFFSLSLGAGVIIVYGSYLAKDVAIGRAAIWIALFDTGVALLAGLAVFPIIFASGLEPSSGPGLVFVTLSLAFGQVDGGAVLGMIFFSLLLFAAWTSSISLMEPAVSYFRESTGAPRVRVAILLGVGIWSLGLLTVFSFNDLSKFYLFEMIDALKNKTLFNLLDGLTTNILLPIGGLGAAIFAGWMMPKAMIFAELGDSWLTRAWYFAIRFIAPLGLLLVALHALEII